MNLRPYQLEALDTTLALAAQGQRRQLGVAATGLGKTVMFTSLAERIGGRCLILAHRDELVQQAVAKLREVWPDAQVGIVRGSDDQVRAQVVVASVQTLSRPNRLARLIDSIDGGASMFGPAGPFSLVVVDEAHHATAPSYQIILQTLRAGAPGCACVDGKIERPATPDEVDAGCELGIAYDPCHVCLGTTRLPPGPLLLGVTATPDRADKAAMSQVFDVIAWSYDLLWGIRAGFLADVRGIEVKIENLSLAGIKTTAGDFNAGQVGQRLEAAHAHLAIVRAWQQYASDRAGTIVFTPTVATAKLTADAFLAAGIPAGFVHGGSTSDERRALLRSYQDRDVRVLVNCAVLTEGFDAPHTDCIIPRATKSRALYTQMVGRGTRPFPGKADCLVMDMVDNAKRHSLITVPTLAGVTGKLGTQLRKGTGTLSAVTLQHDEQLVAQGKLDAEVIDLFRRVKGGGVAWVPTHYPGALERYEVVLGEDPFRYTVVLAERHPEVWTAGYIEPDGTKVVLVAKVPYVQARDAAERYVRHHPAFSVLADSRATWRLKPPSEKQLRLARLYHVQLQPGLNAGQVSDLINRRMAVVRSKNRGVSRRAPRRR